MSKLCTKSPIRASVFLLAMVAVAFAAVQASAKEGFSFATPAEAFAPAWDSTLYVSFSRPIVDGADTEDSKGDLKAKPGGSLSVVAMVPSGRDTYLGLLTAKHVLKYPNAQRAYFKNFRVGGLDEDNVVEFQNQFQSVVDVTTVQSRTHDLALLIVKVPTTDVRGLNPLQPAAKCDVKPGDRVTLLGYPAVWKRLASYIDNSILAPDTFTRRWSEGVFVGDAKTTEFGPVFGITNDATVGNSGGPALNERGELVGVMSAAKDEGQYYFGEEHASNALVSHSYMVDCEATKAFVMKSRAHFLKMLTQTLESRAKILNVK